MIVDGKKIAAQILNQVASRLRRLQNRGRSAKLAVIWVGDKAASRSYIQSKAEAAAAIGLGFTLHHFGASASADFLIKKIQEIQADPSLSGLIVQLPLPRRLNSRAILNAIKPEFDVDCLTELNLGRLAARSFFFLPPTAAAVMEILNYYRINPRGREVVIVGAGELVGRPLALVLLNAGATITVCHRSTKNLSSVTRRAEIVVSGVGKKNLIKGSMIKKGAIVLDAGFSLVGGVSRGDVDFPSVSKKARLLTPTPGGIGPITVANLLLNTIQAAERA